MNADVRRLARRIEELERRLAELQERFDLMEAGAGLTPPAPTE